MGTSIHIVPEPSAPTVAPGAGEPADDDAAVEAAATSAQISTSERTREPLARFRRRIGQLRGDADAFGGDDAPNEVSDLKLEVMLLREENARLKAQSHRPSDVDTLVEHMRRLGAEKGDAEIVDEAWTLLSECLVIREGLEQACAEIQGAIGAVQGRLRNLAAKLDDRALEASSPAVGPADRYRVHTV